jgi:molybdopterin synthase catalytic subunit
MQKEIIQSSYFISGAITVEQVSDFILNDTQTNTGAAQIFLGRVRADLIGEKKVASIYYSAYEAMAEKEIEKIITETAEQHAVISIVVKHSLGKVDAGEICFYVCVSSAHRIASMKACEELVERIKKVVPIFGKEIFADESHQWKKNHFQYE